MSSYYPADRNTILRWRYLKQAFREKNLYGFLQDGQEASMMDSYPSLQQWQHMLHLWDTRGSFLLI